MAERLPWPSDVEVLDVFPDRVVLRRPGVTATVWHNGTFGLHFDSEGLAETFLVLDLTRTDEIRRRHEASLTDAEWLVRLRHWAEPPASISLRRGEVVAEWPGGRRRPPRRLAEFGLVPDTETWNAPYFQGSRFRFAHFRTEEGDDGAVIQWFDPEMDAFGPPVVYLGEFVDYMTAQTIFAPESPQEWTEFNDLFDQGFVWALERMGSFDEPGRVVPMVLEAVADDAELLLSESIAKMLPRISEYPPEVRESVLDAAEARGIGP